MHLWMITLVAACSVDAEEEVFVEHEDCDYSDPAIYPGAEEIPYDGIDNDCDAETPDDDLDGDGLNAVDDCDDDDPALGDTEIPLDGIDNDCDPSTYDDPDWVAEVCARWSADRVDLDEGSWSGSTDTCEPGDISASGRDNALRLVNLYRWMAGLPEVDTSPERDEAAQACALMMRANNTLDHGPPASWDCYSELGAEAAGRSNLSTIPGVRSVDGYIVDFGQNNAATLGHRRWILSNWLTDIGLGSTDRHSCMHVVGGDGDAGAEWTAWPPPGPVPLQAFTLSFGDETIDETGWSLQSDTLDFADADVEVRRDGEPVPVLTDVLGENFGSRKALAIRPDGWSTEAWHAYTVVVSGADFEVEYESYVTDCSSR